MAVLDLVSGAEATDQGVKFPVPSKKKKKLCVSAPLHLSTSTGEALHLIHLPATSNVAENSPPGTLVHKFSVSLSVSGSPVMPLFPLIINSSPFTEAEVFTVNSVTGTDFEVVTTGKAQLDFETGPHTFDLQIYVKDDVGVTDLQVLTVQITDVNEPPQFQGNLAKGLELYVAERAKPGFIYQLEAFDPEDTSQNLPLSYFLISPSTNFEMSANGTLFSTTELDFEAGHKSFHLMAEVRDSGGLKASTVLQVTIVNMNDEIPRFTSTRRVYSIPEELSPGTIVANITAEDPDDAGFPSCLLYSITTACNYLVINQLTGSIQVAQRIDRDAGELRQHPTIYLEVLVRDRPSGGQENRIQITFAVEDINDNPATCTKFTFSIMVMERAANGTLLLDLNKFCFDDDSEAPNNKFNFTTPSGMGSSHRFLQDPAGSGKIVLIGDLDYENPSNLAVGNKFAVRIQVQDTAPPYYKDTIYISVLTRPENEFPLLFASPSYEFNVSETSPARTQVGQVQAADEDYPQSSISYSISTGGASSQHPNIFWINPKTGELQLVTKADYETTSSYVLRIQATNGESTSSVPVTVNILGENDEKPVCTPNSYFLAIPEDLKVGTNIQNFKLICTDLDSSPQSFRYSIGPGNVNNHFTFSPNAGSNVTHLLLASRFDYAGGLDKIWDYKLLVYITDDNLLPGRRKAEALVETGTVTLSIKVMPHPSTIVTTTPRPKITYQVLKENIYSPSMWYVPFIITVGSMLLLGLLVTLIILLAKAIYRHCPRKAGKDKKPLAKKEDMKNLRREVVVEMVKTSTIFDGEAVDPVTGGIYEFNSKTGARKWKDPFTQMPNWTELGPWGAAAGPWRVAAGEGPGPLRRTLGEGDGQRGKAQTENTGLSFPSEDGKLGTPNNRNSALVSRANPQTTQRNMNGI
ncbi:LOW QUALITY PROTEIN: cadherin-related family member 3 [Perognathus longimembris pacificus]|uniref:LOW QUALITY PROTEIN: cadherin-related family member 3 n=1 Tax=Perognathus longimembris pacificus TaxID=214514 RepID=UPI0020185CB2|nr:LOW QUALITY PROTEIN: cadherin-related family member 3 [Perognathus longimembris pacificus]